MMSFRNIRPSAGDSNLSSVGNPNHSIPESTESDPNRARGEKELESTTSSTKRRRVPESVTRNACTNCKKARAKCDGKTPCQRCTSRAETVDCVYEVHIKHAKEELVQTIKELRTRLHLTEQIFQALSNDENVPDILGRIKNGETHEAIVEWLGQSPLETLSPVESHSMFDTASDHEMSGTATSSNFRWTAVISDTAILDHLFQLYFAWIHPVHTLFHEGHFVDSYKRQSRDYCSSILVNALCAMACHLHSAADADGVDFEQLGGRFSDAVKSSINPEDMTVTTIQAFAVMFLVDCARSKGLRGSAYLKVARAGISNIRVADTDGFNEVVKNTIRGIRNLDVEWAQMTFRVPATSINEVQISEDLEDKRDDQNWYFYRNSNENPPAWPGLITTTNREKTKLMKIISETVTIMYAQESSRISAEDILQLYRRLVTWREELPSMLGDINNGSQPLPHVLSLLILYSNAVIHLLRPLLDLEGFSSMSMEAVIWNHAQQGLFLLDEHYRVQYSCRYQPVLQMFATLHHCDTIIRFFPEVVGETGRDGPAAVQLGLETLRESRPGFPVAATLQELLRRTANECTIPVPLNTEKFAAAHASLHDSYSYRMDDMIDACTRPNYVQPVAGIHSKYLPSFSADWAAEGASFGFHDPPFGSRSLRGPSVEERAGAQNLMNISNLLNRN